MQVKAKASAPPVNMIAAFANRASARTLKRTSASSSSVTSSTASVARSPGCPVLHSRRCANNSRKKNGQQLVQIRLSKQMIPRTHCRVPDDCLSCFETKFHMVGKWTESTL